MIAKRINNTIFLLITNPNIPFFISVHYQIDNGTAAHVVNYKHSIVPIIMVIVILPLLKSDLRIHSYCPGTKTYLDLSNDLNRASFLSSRFN